MAGGRARHGMKAGKRQTEKLRRRARSCGVRLGWCSVRLGGGWSCVVQRPMRVVLLRGPSSAGTDAVAALHCSTGRVAHHDEYCAPAPVTLRKAPKQPGQGPCAARTTLRGGKAPRHVVGEYLSLCRQRFSRQSLCNAHRSQQPLLGCGLSMLHRQ